LWTPRGFYWRFLQWLAQAMCAIMLIRIWFDDDVTTWWQNIGFDVGIIGIGTLGIIKRLRKPPPRISRESRLSIGRWIFDYLIGCSVYLMMTWAIVAATSVEPSAQGAVVITALVGNFIVSQLSTTAALRVLNTVIADDYRMGRTQHYISRPFLWLPHSGSCSAATVRRSA
jgi:hypothetical protein